MSETTFDKSRNLKIYARVNEAGVAKKWTFLNEDGSAHDISSYNFIYPVYAKPGGTELFRLTIGDGLTISGAGNNELDFSLSQTRATRRPAVNFGILKALSEDHTWINSDFIFHNGKFDGVNETDTITVAINGGSVTITVSGGGGSVTLASLGTVLQTASNDTPLDADTFNFWDAVDTILKKVTWSNIKATLKTYFDTLYQAILTIKNSGTPITQRANLNIRNGLKAVDNTPDSDIKLGGTFIENTLIDGAFSLEITPEGVSTGTYFGITNTDTVKMDAFSMSDDTASDIQLGVGSALFQAQGDDDSNHGLIFKTGTLASGFVQRLKIHTNGNITISTQAFALTDGASITLTAAKHTLTTDEATITFTDSFTGDFLGIEITLSGITGATWTLPANSLGAYNGVATGTNNIVIAGAVSGDKIIISRWKCGSNYYYVAFNFGQ